MKIEVTVLIQFRILVSSTIVFSLLTAAQEAALADPQASVGGGQGANSAHNFPANSDSTIKSGQKAVQKMMAPQEHIPGWAEVRQIPSLNAETKKLIQELFNKVRTEAAPLQDELKQIRAKFAVPNQASVASSNTVLNSVPVNSANQYKEQNDSGANVALMEQPNALPPAKPTPEQKTRMRELRNQIQQIREKAWEQVKSMLTDEDLHQLQLLEQGKLLPQSSQNSSGTNNGSGNASSSGRSDSSEYPQRH